MLGLLGFASGWSLSKATTTRKPDSGRGPEIQGDASLVVLIGGVVRDLDWTIEVLVKKSHKSETHSDFPGCLKNADFPQPSVCEKLP